MAKILVGSTGFQRSFSDVEVSSLSTTTGHNLERGEFYLETLSHGTIVVGSDSVDIEDRFELFFLQSGGPAHYLGRGVSVTFELGEPCRVQPAYEARWNRPASPDEVASGSELLVSGWGRAAEIPPDAVSAGIIPIALMLYDKTNALRGILTVDYGRAFSLRFIHERSELRAISRQWDIGPYDDLIGHLPSAHQWTILDNTVSD